MELHKQNNYTIDNIQALIDNHLKKAFILNLKEQMLFQKRMQTVYSSSIQSLIKCCTSLSPISSNLF